MEYNLYDNSHSSRRRHNQYPGPRSYGVGAQFTADDLGNQPQFSGQYMQRSVSRYSNTTSHDSALDTLSAQHMYRNNSQSSNTAAYHNSPYSPVEAYNPNAFLDQSANDFPSIADSYSVHPASIRPTISPYTDWQTPRTDYISYEHLMGDSPTSPMSPGMQSSGVQSSQPPKYCCLERNCNTSFARQADLQRHYDHKHTPIDKQKTWWCDWKTCPRSEPGYRDALARLGQSTPSTSSSSPGAQKPVGIGPFTRKDHCKAHLREQHQEAIPKRDAKNDPTWMDGKMLKEEWWRCLKCLKRVWIQTQRNARRSEFTCYGCGATCDQDVLDVRARRFASSSASASVGAAAAVAREGSSTVVRGRRH